MGETQDILVAISVDLMEFCKELPHSFPHLHQLQGDHRKLLESTANHLNHNFISKDLFMVATYYQEDPHPTSLVLPPGRTEQSMYSR